MKLHIINRVIPVAVMTSAVVLFVLFVWVVWWMGSTFIELDREIKVPIIAGLFALAVAAFTYVRENSLKRQEAHRAKKIEIYSILLEMIGQLTKASHGGKADSFIDSPIVLENMFKLNNNLLFYGSPSVLKAFNAFKRQSGQPTDSFTIMDRIGNVLLAMRRDVGLSNFGLGPRELIQVIVKEDIQELANRGKK